MHDYIAWVHSLNLHILRCIWVLHSCSLKTWSSNTPLAACRTIKGSTGEILLQLLEMRLDSIVFRLGKAPTMSAARQIVNHGHITVNGRWDLQNGSTVLSNWAQMILHGSKFPYGQTFLMDSVHFSNCINEQGWRSLFQPEQSRSCWPASSAYVNIACKHSCILCQEHSSLLHMLL